MSNWQLIETAPPDEVVLLFSKDWIDLDFNLKGVREGFLSDDEGWVTSRWNDCHDSWIAVSSSKPTHWIAIPEGPYNYGED